ncbi:MAG: 16S rRNA (guanine(527)-N(7))-methyltransferase RsmG [Provencibacterium sp.]|jgi:16S rRNA (guanine(527)-N(7))-methyltransferase RsmG|nr:16S rRNA (guanine(527)-N(7))-methyltransferase RsmG [Provencibacterium sp.]
MIPKEKLRDWAAGYGIALEEEMLERLDRYAGLLCAYNEKVNLTAITEPEEIARKHFLDSLLLAAALPLPEGTRLADVGTGAGFPGVPLKILRPDLSLTLIDSLQKRITFLQALSQEISLPFEALHLRAEEAGRQKGLREGFSVVTARAVASLPVLCEYCLPLVKPGGSFAALKSRGVQEEIEEAKRAISLLGGELEQVRRFQLPGEEERAIVLIRKISQTPPKYPRSSAKMAKSPL